MDSAVERLQEAPGYAEKIGSIEVADTYGDLAELYIRDGRNAEAEPLLVQRLHTLQHSRIQDELEIANTEADLSDVFILLRMPAMARPLLEHAVPIQERIFATQRNAAEHQGGLLRTCCVQPWVLRSIERSGGKNF